jgi:hypothetical protein
MMYCTFNDEMKGRQNRIKFERQDSNEVDRAGKEVRHVWDKVLKICTEYLFRISYRNLAMIKCYKMLINIT